MLWFSIKVQSSQYRKSHRGDKMILWSSYLYNMISYPVKLASLYGISPRCHNSKWRMRSQVTEMQSDISSVTAWNYLCRQRGERVDNVDGLVQERRNSIVLAMELRLSALTHRHITNHFLMHPIIFIMMRLEKMYKIFKLFKHNFPRNQLIVMSLLLTYIASILSYALRRDSLRETFLQP